MIATWLLYNFFPCKALETANFVEVCGRHGVSLDITRQLRSLCARESFIGIKSIRGPPRPKRSRFPGATSWSLGLAYIDHPT